MSGRRGSEDVVQETNLDAVEVDVDGNLTYANESDHASVCSELSGRETETSIDGVQVDEEGNLRIQSASSLLNVMRDHDGASPESADDLSPAEAEFLQKMRHEKDKYMSDGTKEEEKDMLALDSHDRDSVDGWRGSTHLSESRDHQDIELSVIRNTPEPEPAIERHQVPGTFHSLERGEPPVPDRRPPRKGLGRILDIACRSPKRVVFIAAVIVVVIGILLTVGLLPASFVYVEYYELALAKSRLTGKVNRDDVYHPGCYLLTPDVELVRFQGSAHFVQQNLAILTSDKLSFNLELSLQYFIKPEELGLLFSKYEHNYREVVESLIESTVKNNAFKFSLDHFRLNRSDVERDFKQAVALRLAGNCCPSCCPFQCGASADCRSCRLAGRGCQEGIHMDVRYFQMGAAHVPEEVSERFMLQIVLLIEAERELFYQRHAVETKITERMQQEILNKAAEIREAAQAEALKIRALAEADYEKTVHTTYVKAMKKVFQRLNITQEDHKLSLMYVKALEGISDNLYNLNYDSLKVWN